MMYPQRTSVTLVATLFLAVLVAPAGSAAVDTKAVVGNIVPEVTSISLPVSVQPLAGGVKTVEMTVTAADGNSFQDLVSVDVTVYKPDGTTVHIASAGAVSNGDGNGVTESYDHSFGMQFHDDPGVYTVTAVATDSQGATSTPFSENFTYEELVALALSATAVDFGTLDPGTRSASSTVGVTNKGNVRIDIDTSGTDLSDGNGHAIGVERVKYDLTDGTFTAENNLTATPYTNSGFDLAKGASSSKDSHWQLDTPSGDEQYIPAGTYQGMVTISALKG